MNLSYFLPAIAGVVPDRPAISAYNGNMSYAEFNAEVESISGAFLDRHGLIKGDRVGIAMTNCAEFLPCVFAAWRAGLTVVPINAKLHSREISWILQNCSAKLCIMTPDIVGTNPDATGIPWPETIVTDSADYQALRQGRAHGRVEGEPEDPAWLFYTSGTTGRPKGAVLTHRNLLFASQAYYADISTVGPKDTMVHAAPLSHGSVCMH